MATLKFHGKVEGTTQCERESSLLAAALQAPVPLTHRCGGHARCGTCLVTVETGAEHLSPPGTAEARVLQVLNAAPDQRLACQAWANGDVSVRY